MDYQQAQEYLLNIPRFTSKNEPEKTKAFLEQIGDFSKRIPTVHVAGTNGKGSVCAYLRAGLVEEGLKVANNTTMDPDERDRRARAFFRDGYNCCQSVLMAFQDITGLSGEQTATLSSGFGGGMGRLREVCGSVSAMTFMTGFISPAVNPGNMDDRVGMPREHDRNRPERP